MTNTDSEYPSADEIENELFLPEEEHSSEDTDADGGTDSEESIELSREEYEELKSGNLRQQDYTRKRQAESARVHELESRLAELEAFSESGLDLEDDEMFNEELEDMPESVAKRVKEVDNLKRELTQMKQERVKKDKEAEVQEVVSNLTSLEGDFPILRSQTAKFVVMAYASQVLNNPSLEGLRNAANHITKVFAKGTSASIRKQAAIAKKRKFVDSRVGGGGSPPLRVDKSPKTIREANSLAIEALTQIQKDG